MLHQFAPVIIAFSGGADSALLLKLALDELGPGQTLAVTGVSPSIPPEEQREAEKLANGLGAPFLPLATQEMEKESYRSNPSNRCFFCKEELFEKLEAVRAERGFKTVLDGSNADDAKDWRPGLEAARKLGVRSPLLEAGMTKAEIRALSKEMNLPTWDKPAMPCLSSRVPYGEEITPERLSRIGEAEKLLRSAGFREVRVRDHYPVARIEVPKEELGRLIEEPLRGQIVDGLKKLGYAFVALDLSGFKSGSLNAVPITV